MLLGILMIGQQLDGDMTHFTLLLWTRSLENVYVCTVRSTIVPCLGESWT